MSFREAERSRPLRAGVVLHPQLERTALDYFRRHNIRWWGDRGAPTESPISSQVACVNHLEPARLDPAVGLAVTEAVLPGVERILAVEDGGFVAYEWIGERNYLQERGQTRGANRTSLDAFMVAEAGGERILLLIEWKYTESYPPGKSRARSKHGTDRIAIYRPFLDRADCPIRVTDDQVEALFYDPLEQLMRQTLLGWQMVQAGEFGADDWRHVWVVPAGNTDLLATNPSPNLPGGSLGDAWRGVLKEPARFSILSPSELLAGVDPPDVGRVAGVAPWPIRDVAMTVWRAKIHSERDEFLDRDDLRDAARNFCRRVGVVGVGWGRPYLTVPDGAALEDDSVDACISREATLRITTSRGETTPLISPSRKWATCPASTQLRACGPGHATTAEGERWKPHRKTSRAPTPPRTSLGYRCPTSRRARAG